MNVFPLEGLPLQVDLPTKRDFAVGKPDLLMPPPRRLREEKTEKDSTNPQASELVAADHAEQALEKSSPQPVPVAFRFADGQNEGA